MTKKDYQKIGQAIRQSAYNVRHFGCGELMCPTWQDIAKAIADVFAQDNPI
jgi:hypothetical protein